MTAYRKYPDNELASLLREGDRFAFTEIYDRYWRLLFRAAFQASRDREDSLDICQSLFLWLWENRETIHISTSFKGYLLTAVKYKIADLIRQGKFRESLFEDLEGIDQRRYLENELEIQELKNLIGQLIQLLPERCREVFLLSREEQLSHKEIADKLGLSEKTVDAHISNALGKLKAPLGRLASIFLLL